MAAPVLHSKIRVYVDDVLTGSSTEIGNNVVFVRCQMERETAKGSFAITVRPEKTTTTFTNLWLQDVIPSISKRIKLRAGYLLSGVENLTTIFRGIIKDRNSAWGRSGGGINITGFDHADALEQVTGTWSGTTYGTAKPLMIKILNDALLTEWNFDGFTDFSIAGVEFVNDNGLQVFQRLKQYSQYSFYFDGLGTFVCRDIPTDTTTKYDYSNKGMNNIAFQFSSREIVSEVNVVGNGISVLRRTGLSDQQTYGRKNQFLQNSIITTTAEAEAAADKIISESRKKNCNFQVPFNPYLVTDDIVAVTHEEISGSVKYRVTGFTHWFDGATAKTSISCEEVSPTVPATYTVA